MKERVTALQNQLKGVNWRSLLAGLRARVARTPELLRALKPRAVAFFQSIPARVRAFPGQLRDLVARFQDPENGEFRRMSILKAIAFLFLAVCILGAQNPFGMLVPIFGIDMPVRDSRVTVKVSAYSSQAKGLVTFERRVAFAPTTEESVEQVAHLLVDTSAIQERAAQIDNLPDYGFAIRKVWVWQNSCWIDLRSETLLEETEAFTRNRNKDDLKPVAAYYDAYFSGLTTSVLYTVPACQSIQYLVDGRRPSIKDMKFDLAQVHRRQ